MGSPGDRRLNHGPNWQTPADNALAGYTLAPPANLVFLHFSISPQIVASREALLCRSLSQSQFAGIDPDCLARIGATVFADHLAQREGPAAAGPIIVVQCLTRKPWLGIFTAITSTDLIGPVKIQGCVLNILHCIYKKFQYSAIPCSKVTQVARPPENFGCARRFN